jgi:hypothetical protein
MPVWIWLACLLAIPLIAAVVGLASRRLLSSLLTAVFLLVFVWLFVVAALMTGWQDVRGFIDCGRRCTDAQDAVAVVLFYTPVIVGLLLMTMLVSTVALKLSTEQAPAIKLVGALEHMVI